MHLMRLTITVVICMSAATALGQSAAPAPFFSPAPAWIMAAPTSSPLVQPYRPLPSGIDPAGNVKLGPPADEAWLRPAPNPPGQTMPAPSGVFDPNAPAFENMSPLNPSPISPMGPASSSAPAPGVPGPRVWYSHPRQF